MSPLKFIQSQSSHFNVYKLHDKKISPTIIILKNKSAFMSNTYVEIIKSFKKHKQHK